MISVPIWLFVLLCIPTAILILAILIVIVEAIVISIQERAYERIKQDE